MTSKDQPPHINVDYFEDLTGDIPSPEKETLEDMGNRLKKMRKEKGLSIDDLSSLTGFDIHLLSDIESNKIQPKLGTIIKLSKALDSAFTRLLSGKGNKLYSVTRKNEYKNVSRSTSPNRRIPLYTYRSLAHEVKGRHMESLVVQLDKNPDSEMSVHDGEEFIYVLEGVALLKIGEETIDLETGDSVYYISTIPHMITSKGTKTTVLAVIYEGD